MSRIGRDEITKVAILEAGRRVFQRWGLDKATMEDIAREAGKGKSTLYYYYRKKEEIFEAVVRSETSLLMSGAKDSVKEVSSARERLKRYIVCSVVGTKDSVQFFEIARREAGKGPDFLRKLREHFQAGEVQFLQDILNLGVQQNHFSFANDQELAAASEVIFKLMGSLQLGLLLGTFEIRDIELIARMVVSGI